MLFAIQLTGGALPVPSVPNSRTAVFTRRGATLDLFPALKKRLRDWLEALEQRPGRVRVRLRLDEFERLDEVVGEKPETQ